ncbi:MAG: DUF438 domain-containing protein, partial [bacterium]
MEITPKTKIDGLLTEYPFLLDFLVKLRPEFSKLENPILRKTIGKAASLQQAAALGNIGIDELINNIAGEIQKQTKQKVSVNLKESVKEALTDGKARHEILKDIIRDLHAGKDIELLKKRFAELIKNIESSEIAAMEQKLIDEGMPHEEVKRLCDVHVKVFQEALEAKDTPVAPKGHPVHTLIQENRKTEELIKDMEKQITREKIAVFEEIDRHYLRKENQLFPLLEKHDISGPSQVMWSLHDDIRAQIKALKA